MFKRKLYGDILKRRKNSYELIEKGKKEEGGGGNNSTNVNKKDTESKEENVTTSWNFI